MSATTGDLTILAVLKPSLVGWADSATLWLHRWEKESPRAAEVKPESGQSPLSSENA